MDEVELYDKRFDWLLAALLAVPPVWLFYGFDAAFVSFLVFILIGALKPVIGRLGSRFTTGIAAAGVVLLFSPLLRYPFYNGYCFDATLGVASGLSRYELPEACNRGLFSHLSQELWVGPLRDIALPILGIALVANVLLARKQAEHAQDADETADSVATPAWRTVLFRRELILVLPIFAWGAASTHNYREEQEEIERQRVAAIALEIALVAAARREAERVAEENAAKRVDERWLVDGWAPLDGLSAEIRADPSVYCGTDTGYMFKEDGTYFGPQDSGSYRLESNEVSLSDRIDWANSGFGDEQPASLPPAKLEVERSDDHLIINGVTHGRC